MKFDEISNTKFEEKVFWHCLKQSWKNMKFSSIHHCIKKEENLLDFYQALYGTVFTVITEKLIGEVQYSTICVMMLYLITKTCPEE